MSSWFVCCCQLLMFVVCLRFFFSVCCFDQTAINEIGLVHKILASHYINYLLLACVVSVGILMAISNAI